MSGLVRSDSDSAAPRDSDAEDTALLAEYLQDRTGPCPGCGFDLRGRTDGVCPECGARVRLSVELVDPKLGVFGAGMIGISMLIGFGLLGVVISTVAWIDSGFSVPVPGVTRLVALIWSALIVGLVGMVVWIRRRGRLAGIDEFCRVLLLAACWIAPAAFILMFVWWSV